jgi:hypothetical protein
MSIMLTAEWNLIKWKLVTNMFPVLLTCLPPHKAISMKTFSCSQTEKHSEQ